MHKYIFSALALTILIISLHSCGDDDKNEQTEVNINYKLVYGDDPLVMFNNYTYPGGNDIQFSRISFYASQLMASSSDAVEMIKDVEYIDLTNSHVDLSSAENGMTVSYDYAESDLDQLTFNIGLDQTTNATVPTDYPSSSALSLAGEYWPGWQSYVFAKIEGMIDLDGDGVLEQPVALHLGSDTANRILNTPDNLRSKDLNFVIDIENVFQHDGTIYDISTTPQIHTINEANAIESINFLADGLAGAFQVVN